MNSGVQRVVTHGTFELDGGSWDVDNNIWLVGDDSEVIVIDAAHNAKAIEDAVAGRHVVAPRIEQACSCVAMDSKGAAGWCDRLRSHHASGFRGVVLAETSRWRHCVYIICVYAFHEGNAIDPYDGSGTPRERVTSLRSLCRAAPFR
jgi:hypothetical protein